MLAVVFSEAQSRMTSFPYRAAAAVEAEDELAEVGNIAWSWLSFSARTVYAAQ